MVTVNSRLFPGPWESLMRRSCHLQILQCQFLWRDSLGKHWLDKMHFFVLCLIHYSWEKVQLKIVPSSIVSSMSLKATRKSDGESGSSLVPSALRFQFCLHSHLSEVKCGFSHKHLFSGVLLYHQTIWLHSLYLFSCLIHWPTWEPNEQYYHERRIGILWHTQVKSGPLLVCK